MTWQPLMPSAWLAERKIRTGYQHPVGFRRWPELARDFLPALMEQAKIIGGKDALMQKIAQPVLSLSQNILDLLAQPFRN